MSCSSTRPRSIPVRMRPSPLMVQSSTFTDTRSPGRSRWRILSLLEMT